MSTDLSPDAVYGGEPTPQGQLPLAAEGVQRFVWRMAYGDILIEMRDGCAFVNGERVAPAAETVASGQASGAEAPPSDVAEANLTTRRGP